MRLTRRGWVVLGVAAAGTALAAAFGARSLNAVVVPAVVAVVAAVLQMRWTSPPTVHRRPPSDGFPGDSRTVELRFETDRPFTGTVSDDLPEGIEGGGAIETTVGTEPVAYDVSYAARGTYEIGPVRFRARDVLGLVETSFSGGPTDRIVVYPRIHEIAPGIVEEMIAVREAADADQRHEFDSLREYARGDALRDVHWKSSAKRDDLIVKEFTAPSGVAEVAIGAGAADGAADAMAEAAASLGVALLDRGVPVTLSTPGGSVEAAPGERRVLLEHLAEADAGPVSDETADVLVRAGADTRIAVGGTETVFEHLAAGAGAPETFGTEPTGEIGVGAESTDALDARP
jgi:uncharacterized protein (DUF58 family)